MDSSQGKGSGGAGGRTKGQLPDIFYLIRLRDGFSQNSWRDRNPLEVHTRSPILPLNLPKGLLKIESK